MRPLVSVDKTLYKRLDKNYSEQMMDELHALKAAYPEYFTSDDYHCVVRLYSEVSNSHSRLTITSHSRLTITISNKNPRPSMGIVVALFGILLVILSAIYGWGWE